MRTAPLMSLWTGALACLLIVGGDVALAQNGHATVNCLDEAAGTVQKTLAADCRGKSVSDEEADTLRQKRRAYIQGVLERPTNAGVKGLRLAGLGSGFFIAADGSVVTSHHVIDGCREVSITPTFGEMKLATAVSFDEKTDLALLRSDIAPPAVASLIAGHDPQVFGSAFVIGYPNLGLVTIEPILAPVEVLGRQGNTPYGTAIVVRGDIRRGNSGGPLLDGGGNVVGVVFAKANAVNIYKTTGQLVRDIGYVLPGDVLEAFLNTQAVTYQTTRPEPPKPSSRMLEDARPFLVQVGCWQ